MRTVSTERKNKLCLLASLCARPKRERWALRRDGTTEIHERTNSCFTETSSYYYLFYKQLIVRTSYARTTYIQYYEQLFIRYVITRYYNVTKSNVQVQSNDLLYVILQVVINAWKGFQRTAVSLRRHRKVITKPAHLQNPFRCDGKAYLSKNKLQSSSSIW